MKNKQLFFKQIVLFSLISLFALSSVEVNAEKLGQVPEIAGQVLDSNREPVAGAAIMVEETTIGVLADADGRFSISAKSGQKLIISMMGYVDKVVKVTSNKNYVILIEPAETNLDEVTVVAFSKQKKESVISSIATVNPGELKTPSSNLTTALGGRISGMITQQLSGEPGQDNAQFFVRGVCTFNANARGPLILIDNIELSANELARLQPDDIASFSVLKDASATALYGARGANGVILVKTKEGQQGRAQLNVRFKNVFSTSHKDIEEVDPVSFMKYRNEAVSTRDHLASRPYSNKKIEGTARGLSEYIYPCTNWRDEMFKNYTTNQHLNASLSGGGKTARYYVAASFNNDTGLLKNNPENKFSNNIKFQTVQLRSNININVTRTTQLAMKFTLNFEDYNGPIESGSQLYHMTLATDPVLFPKYYDKNLSTNFQHTKHVLFGNGDGGAHLNPYARLVRGYSDFDKMRLHAQVELTQKLDFITKGLNFRALFSTQRYSFFSLTRAFNPFYYDISSSDQLTGTYTLNELNTNGGTEYLNFVPGSKDINTSMYFESAIDYNRTFAGKHAVSALLVGTMQERLFANHTSLQSSLPYRNMGLAGRLTYGYDSRYLIEANFGYNGSERFAKKHRFGFFPSIGLGWIISNEPWYGEGLKNVMNMFKLKGTCGLAGNDQIGSGADRFFYLSNINMNAGLGYAFGENYTYSPNGIAISRYANDNITWEIARKMNIGFEMELFKSLTLQADYFTDFRSNILMDRASIPSTMGLQAPLRANVGKACSHGYEITLNYQKSFRNGVWLNSRFNTTYASGKYEVFEEPDYGYEWLSMEGKRLNQMRGLLAERLFIDEADIANSPKQTFGEVMPGDIKYKDINGDEIINSQDVVPIGSPTIPTYIFGFGTSVGYKGFDFSMFFQAAAETSFMIDMMHTAPFVNLGVGGAQSRNGMLKVWADDHWSESNRNNYAKWPRLSDYIVQNNCQSSTWWMRDGSYLRLKNVEMGYTLPVKLTQKLGIRSFRVYMSGVNLFTLSNFKLWDVEMGGNGLNYPNQRVFNFGFNLNF